MSGLGPGVVSNRGSSWRRAPLQTLPVLDVLSANVLGKRRGGVSFSGPGCGFVAKMGSTRRPGSSSTFPDLEIFVSTWVGRVTGGNFIFRVKGRMCDGRGIDPEASVLPDPPKTVRFQRRVWARGRGKLHGRACVLSLCPRWAGPEGERLPGFTQSWVRLKK